MAQDRVAPNEQIPEADLLEQRTPLDSQALIDTEHAVASADTSVGGGDEADRLEQATSLPGLDDDDFPHDTVDAGGT